MSEPVQVFLAWSKFCLQDVFLFQSLQLSLKDSNYCAKQYMVLPQILSCPSSYHILQWKNHLLSNKKNEFFLGLGWEFPHGWRGLGKVVSKPASNMASLYIYLKFPGVPPGKANMTSWKITIFNFQIHLQMVAFFMVMLLVFSGANVFWDSWDSIQTLHQVFNYSDNLRGN